MNSTATRRLSTSIGWGAFIVLAWAALTLLVSSGTAHADEDADGPLDGVTSLIGSTVGAGSGLVSDVVKEAVPTVVEKVAPVVTKTVPAVAAPATNTVAATVQAIPVVRDVVPPIVTPVAQATTETVAEVTTPLTDALQDSPVAQLTDPVLEVVSDVPIVGHLVDDLALPDAVTDIAGSVDATTAALGSTVEDAVPPVLDAVEAVVPPAPSTPGADTGTDVVVESPVVNLPPRADAVTDGSRVTASTAVLVSSSAFVERYATPAFEQATSTAEPDATGVPVRPTGPAHAPPGITSGPSSSSSGSPGGSVGDAARLSDASADALHAWHRALGDVDDDLPCSPVAETDASPD
ncbi:hypothetical protein [Microbacterium sp. Bi121]|uniref:hypothetical protein n=1 Tax=Microbacterium sp. Bi121 TaxID=2822348 RepID=UPI001DF443CC|nr:hypothetical protein [Microbacterium sp. Bi121]CAH0141033.1 hypothetical protein SRABI121_01006 [Microbacterium sp. Bi121]